MPVRKDVDLKIKNWNHIFHKRNQFNEKKTSEAWERLLSAHRRHEA
jgi:hypothetical protein